MDLYEYVAKLYELYSFNTNKNAFKKTLKSFSNAWKNSSKKKPKKNKKNKNQTENQTLTNDKYTMLSFKNELIKELAKYFSEETMLYVSNNSIFIYSKDELGVNINLYFVFGMEGEFRLFNTSTYSLTEINFKDRDANFNKKIKNKYFNFTHTIRKIKI